MQTRRSAPTRLAKEIYSSDARFVFELLQNADDNQFERAKDHGALPFISFERHPDRIVVECNEDGFTEENFLSICQVGKSTKKTSYGYTGNKGIGFKSVFMVATKVTIHSGYFSFYFKHNYGDSGLGMAIPHWEDRDTGDPCPVTRMTLTLRKAGPPDEPQAVQRRVDEQLQNLQYSCLLFLRRIKEVHVSFYGVKGELISSKKFSLGEEDSHRCSITITSTKPGHQSEVLKKHFHVTKATISNLEKASGRDTPSTGPTDSHSSAEVVLAFPLDEDSKPLIGEPQHLYSFLPVRETSFRVSKSSVTPLTTSARDGCLEVQHG